MNQGLSTKKEPKKEDTGGLFDEPEVQKKKEDKNPLMFEEPLEIKKEKKKDTGGLFDEPEVQKKEEKKKEIKGPLGGGLFDEPETKKETSEEKKNFQNNIIAGLQRNTGSSTKKQAPNSLFDSEQEPPLTKTQKENKEIGNPLSKKETKSNNLFSTGDDPESPRTKKELPRDLFMEQNNLFDFDEPKVVKTETPKPKNDLFDIEEEPKKRKNTK